MQYVRRHLGHQEALEMARSLRVAYFTSLISGWLLIGVPVAGQVAATFHAMQWELAWIALAVAVCAPLLLNILAMLSNKDLMYVEAISSGG